MALEPISPDNVPYTERLAKLVYWLIAGPILVIIGLLALAIVLGLVGWTGETAVAVLGRPLIRVVGLVGIMASPALLVLAAWIVHWIRKPVTSSLKS